MLDVKMQKIQLSLTVYGCCKNAQIDTVLSLKHCVWARYLTFYSCCKNAKPYFFVCCKNAKLKLRYFIEYSAHFKKMTMKNDLHTILGRHLRQGFKIKWM
jgi:hypothetical protein